MLGVWCVVWAKAHICVLRCGIITSMDDQSIPLGRVRLVRHEDDSGLVSRGKLIPLAVAPRAPILPAAPPPRTLLVVLASFLCALFGVGAAYGPALYTGKISLSFEDMAATVMGAPALLLADPMTGVAQAPAYGPSLRYAEREFYEKQRVALVSGTASFVAVDVPAGRIQVFVRGVLEADVPVIHVPSSSSWCTMLPGLYEVEGKGEESYSSVLSVYLPYSVTFGGNRALHGWPKQTSGERVHDDYDRDCLRLSTEDAARVYEKITTKMPIIVHASAPSPEPAKVFESKVPNFPTPYYLIADAESDTVLAVGDTHGAVPIASLTKLMTALVVMENLSLDTMVTVGEESLITSIVPRLKGRAEVSVYSLLEVLLVESSNEAAEVLASAVGREKFVALMNQKALELGMVDTVFTDPAGIEASNVSSVNDLWWLMRHLHRHYPQLVALTNDKGTPPAGLEDTFSGLSNFNLLETDDTFIGGKIGETEAAGQTSVTIHRLSFGGTTRDVIIVLLGSSGRTADVTALLDYLRDRFGE